MTRFSTLFLSLFVAAGLLFVGCDSNSSSSDGSMDMTMTESSSSSTTSSKSTAKSSHIGNVKEARVTFADVTVVSEGSEDEETSLSAEAFSVDLMKLNQDIDTTIANLNIPTGTYEQIRLKANKDTKEHVALTFEDGDTNTAMIASSEIKLNFQSPFTIESADDKVSVTVDWDVGNSLKGNNAGTNLEANNLVITPVVQATATVTSATDDSDDGSTN